MNKKQFIVAWIMGILTVIIHFYNVEETRYYNFEEFILSSMPVFIIGGLLLYTFRSKKQ